MRDTAKTFSAGPGSGRGSRRQGAIAAALLALCATFALAASPAYATTGHVFDPVLSLTGDCSTSALDEVPDPGLCPGTVGVDHPPKKFDNPCGVATDPHGDIYVASAALGKTGTGTGGRIDVFDPEGKYLSEIKDEKQPCDLAVDSEGNVYVLEYAGKDVALFEPKTYPPIPGSEYGPRIRVVGEGDIEGSNLCAAYPRAIAIDPSNDRLWVNLRCKIAEFDSATDGSALITGSIGTDLGYTFYGIAVLGRNHDIYAPGATSQLYAEYSDPANQRVFVLDSTDGHLKAAYDGADTPAGNFGWFANNAVGIALDQASGDPYLVRDQDTNAIEQLDAAGHYIGELEKPLVGGGTGIRGLAVDGPCRKGSELSEPCRLDEAYDSPNAGHVFVTSGSSAANSRLYAFAPKVGEAPAIDGQVATEITEAEAVLRAEVNPGSVPTSYRFEYTTQAAFKAHGYEGATSVPAPDADAGEGGSFLAVSEPIAGLEAGTAYRFRLVADNEECLAGPTAGEGKPCEEGEDAAFATYPPEEGLPDGRAYELVTPPDTNGRIPSMGELASRNPDDAFDTPFASPDGESVVFGIDGGSLPGLGGGGYHDIFRAVRGPGGWQSQFTGLSAAQAEVPRSGGISADHGYSFWKVEGRNGSLADPVRQGAHYLRGPDGSFEPIGLGSLGADPGAVGKWITPGASHIVFTTNHTVNSTPQQLEPNAPPTGTVAIYDRTPDGPTHVVSLLPGEVTPAAEEDASFQGVSADGEAIAFKLNGTLYARLHNAETVQVAGGDSVFAAISRDGGHVFYLAPNPSEPLLVGTEIPQGEIFACDIASGPCAGPDKSHEPIQIGSGEESMVVNVSADGSHVYFVSPKQLDGAEGEAGAHNLYAWDAAAVRFIATVSERDVIGEQAEFVSTGSVIDGLGLWVQGTDARRVLSQIGGPGADPSRTTPDGSVLVFESNAGLTPYESAGHAEIYRYDAAGESLVCVSCNPTGAPGVSDARLQSGSGGQYKSLPPLIALAQVPNLTPDGQAVFFESADPLALGDIDGKIDVYQWKAQGTPGCDRPGGCIFLISSGRSAGDDYLYAISADGSSVFFESQDLLVPEDRDGTPSIYDARVGGGFPPQPWPPGECLGEACQPAVVAPDDPTPASSSFTGPGNPSPATKDRCPKGKRKVRRGGRTRCVKRPAGKHKRQRKTDRTHANRRAHR